MLFFLPLCDILTCTACIFFSFCLSADWQCFVQIFRLLMRINSRVLLVLLLFGLGALFYIGASTSPIIVFVYSVCIISFLVSIYLTKWVLAKDEGPPEMVQVNLFLLSTMFPSYLSVDMQEVLFWFLV